MLALEDRDASMDPLKHIIKGVRQRVSLQRGMANRSFDACRVLTKDRFEAVEQEGGHSHSKLAPLMHIFNAACKEWKM